jgi:acetyltransferase-like isoleucine patch superfamily enzyme
MKDKIKYFLKKNPFLRKYARLLLILVSNRKVLKTIPKKIIKGSGNEINVHKSVILYNCILDIKGEGNTIEIESASIFNNVTFFIRGDNNTIKIGENVKFNRGGEIWVEDFNCKVIIENNSTFENVHIAVTEPNSVVRIGENCMFADNIDIRTGDSHSIIDSLTKKRINYAQNINIGNHVWIASHVSILKGVHIGDNSVVATRALVTKSFKENNILIGGVPAKKIKENIEWDRERIYED